MNVTENTQYKLLKVPFHLHNSLSIFQRYVNNIFRNLLRDGTVIIYLDDIIILAKDKQEGLEKLMYVQQNASKFSLEFRSILQQSENGKL